MENFQIIFRRMERCVFRSGSGIVNNFRYESATGSKDRVSRMMLETKSRDTLLSFLSYKII